MKAIAFVSIFFAAIVMDTTNVAVAESGMQPGDPLGAFHVVKAAGANDDGVDGGGTFGQDTRRTGAQDHLRRLIDQCGHP